jgi:hypothetical protein
MKVAKRLAINEAKSRHEKGSKKPTKKVAKHCNDGPILILPNLHSFLFNFILLHDIACFCILLLAFVNM